MASNNSGNEAAPTSNNAIFWMWNESRIGLWNLSMMAFNWALMP